MIKTAHQLVAVGEVEAALRQILREEVADRQNSMSPWFDLDGAADYVRMSPDAIRSAEKRGQLRGHRSVTGGVRFHRDDLDSFIRGEQAT